jgi:hypothetical protein
MSAQDVLVLAEVQRGALADITLELLAAARGVTAATGGQVVCLVLSEDGAKYAPSLAAADRIVWSTIRSWPLLRRSPTWRRCCRWSPRNSRGPCWSAARPSAGIWPRWDKN